MPKPGIENQHKEMKENTNSRVWSALPPVKQVEILEMALLLALAKQYGRGCGWIYMDALKLRKEAMVIVLNKPTTN